MEEIPGYSESDLKRLHHSRSMMLRFILRLNGAEREYWFGHWKRADGSWDVPLLPEDSSQVVGLHRIWGLTVKTRLGACFFQVMRWHDNEQEHFRHTVQEGDEFTREMARFFADRWPDTADRPALQRAVARYFWAIRLYGWARWEVIGGKP